MNDVTRQQARARIDHIYQATKDENLAARYMVDDARKPSSPLHDLFEWDDAVAADQQRISRARTLLRTYKIDIRTDHKVITSVAYVRNPIAAHRQQGYVHINKLRSDRELALAALRSYFGRAMGYLRSSRNLAEVLDLVDEFDELLDNMESFEQKIAKAGKPAPVVTKRKGRGPTQPSARV
jgi:hypothetical protein